MLHSARDECELNDAMKGLAENVSDVEVDKWKSYRDLDWNYDDFDEYPQERIKDTSA